MGRMDVWLVLLLASASSITVSAGDPTGDIPEASPFSDISVTEMLQVKNYLNNQATLNLVQNNLAKTTDSIIILIEALRPPKAETLRYLDGSGPLPQRAARVILQRGDLPVPQMQEYKVYPIPEPSNFEQIKNPKWRDPIPFTSRPPANLPELSALQRMVRRLLQPIHDLLLEISGGYGFFNCSKKCLRWSAALPPYVESGHHKLFLHIVRRVEGYYLHPIGVQFVLNLDAVNPDDWFVEKVWIQGQYFQNFTEVLWERNKNSLNITKLRDLEDPHGENLTSSLNFRGEPRPSSPQRKPHMVMPDGNRFSVSKRHIKWMGWEFEFGMLQSSGIQLFDVKFLKERIAYELSLQEVAVFYSGGSPLPQHSTFFDSLNHLGRQVSQLIPGIDCPSHAEFFDFVHLHYGFPFVFRDSACVFEHDRGIPLRRHTESSGRGYRYVQGIPDSVLIFRQILTVGNYEYIIDFMFHQAGQIEGKVSLSGYILSSFNTGQGMNKYGSVLNEPTTIGNIHHHVLHIKADLDIMGTSNRFETLDIQLENITDEINEGETILNRYFTHNLKRTETEAAYKFNFSNPKYLIMYNDAEKNKFGHAKGYRILADGISKLLLPKNYRGYRSRAWASYQVAVTKQHEDELFSSSIYASMEPYDPVMSFEDYIADDEDIVDQDLVAWITLGTHHIPHSEDVPIVNTPAVQLTFFLLPYNYFEEDPSLASRDNIRVTRGNKGPDYKYSGVSGEGACPKILGVNTTFREEMTTLSHLESTDSSTIKITEQMTTLSHLESTDPSTIKGTEESIGSKTNNVETSTVGARKSTGTVLANNCVLLIVASFGIIGFKMQ